VGEEAGECMRGGVKPDLIGTWVWIVIPKSYPAVDNAAGPLKDYIRPDGLAFITETITY
jgi:hypothetical protein